MDYLIYIHRTGNLEEFETKINTPGSTCEEHLRLLQELGRKSQFNSYKNSCYHEEIINFSDYKNTPINQKLPAKDNDSKAYLKTLTKPVQQSNFPGL